MRTKNKVSFFSCLDEFIYKVVSNVIYFQIQAIQSTEKATENNVIRIVSPKLYLHMEPIQKKRRTKVEKNQLSQVIVNILKFFSCNYRH